jgi:hypothetical protein
MFVRLGLSNMGFNSISDAKLDCETQSFLNCFNQLSGKWTSIKRHG